MISIFYLHTDIIVTLYFIS